MYFILNSGNQRKRVFIGVDRDSTAVFGNGTGPVPVILYHSEHRYGDAQFLQQRLNRRYMALAACIVLAVLATVRLALPSESTGAASGEPQAAQFGIAAAPGEIDPRNSDAGADCAAPDPSPAEETSQREEPTADEPADGAANGVLEQAGEDETPAVEQFGASGGSAVQLDAEQITSIEISSPDGDTTVTDEDGIGLIAALLSPSGQAQSWKALGEASYSVDINYAGGSARLDVYVADGSLVCITDGGGAYSAAGSPAEFLDALN